MRHRATPPTVALVVRVVDEPGKRLAAASAAQLAALDRERGGDVEVVIADGRTGAAAEDEGPRPAWVRVLRRPGMSRGALSNAAARATSAPILVFLSDDVVPAPGLVAAHRALHAEAGRDDAVGVGPILFPPRLRADPFRRWLEDSGALFGVSYTSPDPRTLRTYFHAANTSISRALLARAGPFREDFVGPVLDDDEMGRRLRALGVSFTYLPDAIGLHEHPVTLSERRRAVLGHGRAAARLDAGGPPTTRWPTDLRRTTLGLYARAALAALRAPFARRDDARARFYRRLLAADFARGYRSGPAGTQRGASPPATRRSPRPSRG